MISYISGLANEKQTVCRIDREGRFLEIYGPKGMDPKESIGKSIYERLINPNEAKTLKRLIGQAEQISTIFTMPATVCHNREIVCRFLRIQPYGFDLLILSKRI